MRVKSKDELSSLGLDEEGIYSAAEDDATNMESLSLSNKKNFLKPVLLSLLVAGFIGGGWYLLEPAAPKTMEKVKTVETVKIVEKAKSSEKTAKVVEKPKVVESVVKTPPAVKTEQAIKVVSTKAAKELTLEEKLVALEQEEANFIAKQKEAHARLQALKAKKAEIDKEKVKQAAIALQEKELKEREEKLALLKTQKQEILNAQEKEKQRLAQKAEEVKRWHETEQTKLTTEKQLLEEKMNALVAEMQSVKEKEQEVKSTLIDKQVALEQELKKAKEQDKAIITATQQTEEEIQQMLAEIEHIRNLSVSEIIHNKKEDLQQLTPNVDINTLSFNDNKPVPKKIVYSQSWQSMMLKKMAGNYDDKGTWLEVKIKNLI